MAPIPTGRYEGPKTDNAVNIRISPQGINYLNANWRTLLDMFAPGQVMNFPVPHMWIRPACPGGDRRPGNCSTKACGRLDGKCDSKDIPENVDIRITGFQLSPQAPDTVEGRVIRQSTSETRSTEHLLDLA